MVTNMSTDWTVNVVVNIFSIPHPEWLRNHLT